MPGLEEQQTDSWRGGRKRRETKERKISVLPSSQSSVMMLMFRFSQEFPRRGNDTTVILSSLLHSGTHWSLQIFPFPWQILGLRHLQLQGTAPSFVFTHQWLPLEEASRFSCSANSCSRATSSQQRRITEQKCSQLSVAPHPKTHFAERQRDLNLC